MKDFKISTCWDTEAQVWTAGSDDIPGLVAEARTLQDLVRKLQQLVPELCDLNSHLMKSHPGRILITADYERFEKELHFDQ